MPIAGRLLTLLRLGAARVVAAFRYLACLTCQRRRVPEFSGRFPGTFSVHSGSSAGGILIEPEFSPRILRTQQAFSDPEFLLRLSGILTEIDFARLSSTAFIHIMRTMEDTRAEFRTRRARAGPRGSFGTLLDPD